jgi:hypothetical protein
MEWEGEIKASVFLDLSRERKGQEAEGGRESGERWNCLPTAHSPPTPHFFFHLLLFLLLTCPPARSLARREGEERTFRRYRCLSVDGVLAAPNPGSNPWTSERGDGFRRRHWWSGVSCSPFPSLPSPVLRLIMSRARDSGSYGGERRGGKGSVFGGCAGGTKPRFDSCPPVDPQFRHLWYGCWGAVLAQVACYQQLRLFFSVIFM